MSKYVICLPMRRGTFLEAKRICFPIYIDEELPPHVPGPDPYEHLKALGTIVQLASSLSELTPLRQELVDVAQRALETAVEGLGEGAELVDLAARPVQSI